MFLADFRIFFEFFIFLLVRFFLSFSQNPLDRCSFFSFDPSTFFEFPRVPLMSLFSFDFSVFWLMRFVLSISSRSPLMSMMPKERTRIRSRIRKALESS